MGASSSHSCYMHHNVHMSEILVGKSDLSHSCVSLFCYRAVHRNGSKEGERKVGTLAARRNKPVSANKVTPLTVTCHSYVCPQE